MHARRLAKPASVFARRRANICSLEVSTLARTFIDPRKHFPDNLDHLALQAVEFAAQPLYFLLALFTATVEIAHAPPSYPTSSWNCSNSPRKFSGAPVVPSLMIGAIV
jgi:hypothetical protein